MTLTHRAQATAAALFFAFSGIFALGIASGGPAQAEWLVEIEAAHQVKAIEAPEALAAPKAVPACEAAAKADLAAEIEI